MNFHPDTPFEDYVNIETNEPTYIQEEADLRNKLLNDCFKVCAAEAVDIYEFGLYMLQDDSVLE